MHKGREIDARETNIKSRENLLGFTHVDFENLGKVENQVEEAIYSMTKKFKTNPLEIANSMRKVYMTELSRNDTFV